ncbi:MAG: hypothetical protein COA82_12810 [Alkaliphilus sp.]|nr:hypothetical protein [bacterium AH-315-K05]MBN4069908.1 hypothetical protein [bacterium AH-315-G05]MBN4074709.1 hypothetical protein [bacterium AH-315-E09]PHS29259.1 MAG: hypothetical protein COA82_12810 [Alkaliphilus sp.]
MDFEKLVITILYIHQTMDVVGVKGYVDRPKLISPDTIGWAILSVLMVLYYLGFSYINLVFIGLFGLVLYGLYHFHWKLYIFGATAEKIEGYNIYFKGTHRILSKSSIRLVPDTYHIIHSILYSVAFITLCVNFFIG